MAVEYQHLVARRGAFELVALTDGPELSDDRIHGYALVTASGARIWQDLSLSEGCLRLEAAASTEVALPELQEVRQERPWTGAASRSKKR